MTVHHVVLGAGGIGGLLAAVLRRSGEEVTVVARPSAARGRRHRFDVRSRVFGDFVADVDVAGAMPSGADVLWVAVKSTGLEAALDLVDPGHVGDAAVVPLLNGIDHVATLRRRFRHVCPGTIRIESHRVAPGRIEQPSPFAHVAVAPGLRTGPVPSALDAVASGGFATSTSDDETTLLWDKLAFLAPVALATAAFGEPLGAVRDGPDFVACRQEAVTAAHRDGATTDLDAVRALTDAAPAGMTSSMQHDVDAGREPELDAVAGAVLRRLGEQEAPATRSLAERVRARLSSGS